MTVGLGQTIDTDLVGELIAVLMPFATSTARVWPAPTEFREIARGRCRAVHLDKDGDLILWLEMIADVEGRVAGHADPPVLGAEIGDVIRVSAGNRNGTSILRLIKEPR